jgi:hypothetical protein
MGRLGALRAVLSVRETGRDPLSECFDPGAVAGQFLSDYRRLFESYVGEVRVGKKSLSRDEGREVLNRFLLRVLLVAFLQTKGWLVFDGRRDYLQSLYASWKSSPGGHLFHQRLALVFFNALDEPRHDARKMLVPQIGDVPHIGGGIFASELFEKEFGFATFPESLFEELFGESGLLARYDFVIAENKLHERTVALTPEVMGAVLAAFLSDGAAPVFEETAVHRASCRRVIASQIGANTKLEKPHDKNLLGEWIEALRGLHVFDGTCRTGTYLVAALEELADFSCRIEDETDRSAVKRRVVAENLRGLDQDELCVQVTRFRLALALLAGDEAPTPIPDLRQVVKRGGTLAAEVARAFPREGAKIEYKASFEWDPRRGAKSPEMRHGCLRTIAAFMNSDGGTLYIGVSDSGEAVGMEEDFSLVGEGGADAFEARFREFMKGALDPLPLNNVTFKFEEVDGLTVCAIEVRAAPGVTYLKHKDKSGQDVESVFVRDGNRTIELRGRARDAFVVSRR